MKKTFNISFEKNDVFQARLCVAETEEQAKAYFEYIEPKARVIGIRENDEGYKPGKPCETVPDNWETPEQKKEDENMTEFTEIKKIVIEDSNARKENRAFYILNGYMPTWAEEHRTDSDRGLKEYSTETRWTQYTRGEITREKAVELATKRALKAIEKDTAAELAKLDRVAKAADLTFISISVDWVRSRTWGYNPHAEAHTNTGFYSGTASGCGYDKEPAAIAEALNQCDSVLKALYTLKEKGLRAGKSDRSKTASCGRSNGEICGYGAGYGAIPYFEGGVGSSCFWEILRKCGYKTSGHHGKHSDYYSVEKEVA